MTINRLIEGFRSFRSSYYDEQPDFYQDLVDNGQKPDVMVIACSDSRVNPSIIAKARPGELFIVRNVANLVPPYQPDSHYHGTSAAIEFAIRDLKVQHVIVLGHSHCGGIQCLCDGHVGGESREFIEDWVSIVQEARDDSLEGTAQYRHVEREAVRISLRNLMTFPWLAERVAKGELTLHGWLFDLSAGNLLAHEENGNWTNLSG